MLWWFSIFVFSCYLAYKFIIKPTRYWEELGVPHVKGWPVTGSIAQAIFRKKALCYLMKEFYQKFSKERYYGLYIFGKPILVIKDIDLIKRITVKDFDHFIDHSAMFPEEVDPLMGKNLLGMKGQKWKEMRATLSPAFTGSKMRAMFTLMSDCAKDVVEYLFKESNDRVLQLEIKDLFAKYSNDVIATAAFGIKCDSLNEPNNVFFSMGKKLTNLSGLLIFIKFTFASLTPKLLHYLGITIVSKDASSYFKTIVLKTIETRERQNILRPDMINLLIQAKKGQLRYDGKSEQDTGFATAQESELGKNGKKKMKLSDDDLVAQALIFFFAGFEASSSVMSFMALELGINSDVQKRLYEEIQCTLSNCDGNVTYDVVLQMKYLDQVVSETLRKWTPTFQLDRMCIKDYLITPKTDEEMSLLVKSGSKIAIPVVGIHYNPKYFPNPDRFDPDRFSDENKSSILPYTYMPFGVGPRNCIGSRFALLEIKVLFFNLLSKFEIQLTERSPVPMKLSIKGVQHTIDGGIWIGLKPRAL